MTSHAARTSLVQKCRKTGTRATCWVIPKIVWKKFADHPANSLRARLGPETLDGAPPMPRASTGSSIKAGNLLRYFARGYQPNEEMSIADRGTPSALLYTGAGIGR